MAKEQEATASIRAAKGISVDGAGAAFFFQTSPLEEEKKWHFCYVFTLFPSGSGKSSVKYRGGSRQGVDRWLSLQTFLLGSFPGG